MKLLIGSILLLKISVMPVFANVEDDNIDNCKSSVSKLMQFEEKNTNFYRLMVTEQVNRESFLNDLYYGDLLKDEGRALYIPHGRYDSIYRSIRIVEKNKKDIAQKVDNLYHEFNNIITTLKKNCDNN